DDTAVDLGDEAARAGAGRREVAGKGEPATADVVGRQWLALGEGRVGDRGDGPHVGEFEDGRVVEVDVGVPQAVEDEGAAAGPVGVGDDPGAVVPGLHVAAAGRDQGGESAGDDRARQGGDAAPAAFSPL